MTLSGARSRIDESRALRAIVEGTAAATGQPFFARLVENLARALGTRGAWVTELVDGGCRLRALAFWLDGRLIDGYEYELPGTPCEAVVTQRRLVHVPDRVVELYPDDRDLVEQQAVSYLGAPLVDVDGTILGNLAVLDGQPLPEEQRLLGLFQVFATRATAELQRLRAEAARAEHEEELFSLVESAMDAIVGLDAQLRVRRLNPAGEKILAGRAQELIGQPFSRFLCPASGRTLAALAAALPEKPAAERSTWMSGELQATRCDGSPFAAEASLSCFEVRGELRYTLILRDVDERREAERRIRSLTSEAEYLRREIRGHRDFEHILGRSPALQRVLQDVAQVATTDATVLVLGETGTGKELIARAIHEASRRATAPFIRLNCAAIPATLVESELFGHEKGAFTGATSRRDGRFTLADGGTIFLDEVGELPLELQGKLLRVLQEGELEPVGSSQTRRVDVRIVAATNRDLQDAVQQGQFRDDLYYRLDTFPIRVPPLRERGDDVTLLAQALVERIARQLGRTIDPPSPADLHRLRSYPWPGNVRELENVLERAIITATGTHLNLDRALPEAAGGSAPLPVRREADAGNERILTEAEVRALERDNLLRALQATGWQVAGEAGAAHLLDLNPSTFRSRVRALGIRRP